MSGSLSPHLWIVEDQPRQPSFVANSCEWCLATQSKSCCNGMLRCYLSRHDVLDWIQVRLNVQCEWLCNLHWMWWELQLDSTSLQPLPKRTRNDAAFHVAFPLLPRCNWLVLGAPEAASAVKTVATDACEASDDSLVALRMQWLSWAWTAPTHARNQMKACTDRMNKRSKC